MKNFINSLFVCAILAVVSTCFIGCSTTSVVSTNPNGTTTTNNVTTANTNLIVSIEGIALTTGTQLGVTAFLKNNPKDVSYVALLGQALNGLIQSGNFNSTSFTTAVNNAIGTNAPPEVVALASDLINLYNGSVAVVVANKIDSNIFIKTAIQSVANGLAASQ